MSDKKENHEALNALVTRAVAGERNAFEELVRRTELKARKIALTCRNLIDKAIFVEPG